MNLGEMGGYVLRISELVDAAKLKNDGCGGCDNQALEIADKLTGRNIENQETTKNLLEVEHLLITPPTNPHVAIINNLTFELPLNQSLLITGESGVGKTSILRAISGLWPHQGILRKGFESAYFLPQRPYFPVGRLSLKQQLVFPNTFTNTSTIIDEQIVKLLHELKLAHLLTLVGHLEDSVDFEWQETLSPGEQQRLVFARMILSNPSVVFLDEASCNVDEQLEQKMFEILQRSNINYITVGHRQSLRSYHNYELRIPMRLIVRVIIFLAILTALISAASIDNKLRKIGCNVWTYNCKYKSNDANKIFCEMTCDKSNIVPYLRMYSIGFITVFIKVIVSNWTGMVRLEMIEELEAELG
ncbi:unnamed protein product [Caenorhabditis angaria]|uniref:ABC transporter domain-containing protein n=1 Tax=Caenorhabditis angaria TaxID=860376 RepID=A0A9P1N7F5_9PELO|nr:unnamed protein product [Caenorhabditis angaria]